jgi:hypothetical protein
MTAKPEKTKRQEGFPKRERLGDLRASIEDELFTVGPLKPSFGLSGAVQSWKGQLREAGILLILIPGSHFLLIPE